MQNKTIEDILKISHSLLNNWVVWSKNVFDFFLIPKQRPFPTTDCAAIFFFITPIAVAGNQTYISRAATWPMTFWTTLYQLSYRVADTTKHKGATPTRVQNELSQAKNGTSGGDIFAQRLRKRFLLSRPGFESRKFFKWIFDRSSKREISNFYWDKWMSYHPAPVSLKLHQAGFLGCLNRSLHNAATWTTRHLVTTH